MTFNLLGWKVARELVVYLMLSDNRRPWTFAPTTNTTCRFDDLLWMSWYFLGRTCPCVEQKKLLVGDPPYPPMKGIT
ncbi:unnamed protein product, partial [Iphiclides podalirius]